MKDLAGVQDIFCGPETVVHMKRGSAALAPEAIEKALAEFEIACETLDCVNAGPEAKEAWWEQMRSVGWEAPLDQVEALGADRLAGFKEAVFHALDRQMRADGLHFAKSVSFVFGTK